MDENISAIYYCGGIWHHQDKYQTSQCVRQKDSANVTKYFNGIEERFNEQCFCSLLPIEKRHNSSIRNELTPLLIVMQYQFYITGFLIYCKKELIKMIFHRSQPSYVNYNLELIENNSKTRIVPYVKGFASDCIASMLCYYWSAVVYSNLQISISHVTNSILMSVLRNRMKTTLVYK